jgi:hypothetical protein
MNEEKEQNRVLREQDELARLLHNRKIREQRKRTRQQRTLEWARKKPAMGTLSIRGLDNSALVKAVAGRFKSSRIRKVIISNAHGSSTTKVFYNPALTNPALKIGNTP